MGCQQGAHVAGHVNLGDDGDVAAGGIGDEFADLLLRVKIRAVRRAVRIAAVAAAGGTRPDAALLGNLGILLNLDAPALIVGDVPVQDIHLVGRHGVDLRAEGLRTHKMAGVVEVGAAPGQAGSVADDDAGGLPLDVAHRAVGVNLRREELAQRLIAVERAGPVGRGDADIVLGDGEAVPLLGLPGVADKDDVAGLGPAALRHGQRVPGGGTELLGGQDGLPGKGRIGDNGGIVIETEGRRAGKFLHLAGFRNDGNGRCGRPCGQQDGGGQGCAAQTVHRRGPFCRDSARGLLRLIRAGRH